MYFWTTIIFCCDTVIAFFIEESQKIHQIKSLQRITLWGTLKSLEKSRGISPVQLAACSISDALITRIPADEEPLCGNAAVCVVIIIIIIIINLFITIYYRYDYRLS